MRVVDNGAKRAQTFLTGAGLGLGLMYFLDPDVGARRRAHLRDKMIHLSRELERGLDKALRDAGNRIRGLFADALSPIRRLMGRSHEESARVRSIARPRRSPLTREMWPPATRLVASSAALMLVMSASRRQDPLRVPLIIIGGLLGLRAASNRPLRRLLGIGAGRRVLDLHKTITVHAPLGEVFDFWTHFENFPLFMDHVRSVHKVDAQHSRWTVAGPADVGVEFDTEITRLVPKEIVAWQTLPGSTVEHAGVMRFEEVGDHMTRLDIRMSYNPPAGVLGHLVASLFRMDPKRAMDEDLVRMKSLLEQGKARAHGEQITLDEVKNNAKT
jgi:uncharacterized membrane protein